MYSMQDFKKNTYRIIKLQVYNKKKIDFNFRHNNIVIDIIASTYYIHPVERMLLPTGRKQYGIHS